MGDIVDSGIGLSNRPASLCNLAGRYDNPMPESTLSSQSGTMNLATAFHPNEDECRRMLPQLLKYGKTKRKGRERGKGREGVETDLMSQCRHFMEHGQHDDFGHNSQLALTPERGLRIWALDVVSKGSITRCLEPPPPPPPNFLIPEQKFKYERESNIFMCIFSSCSLNHRFLQVQHFFSLHKNACQSIKCHESGICTWQTKKKRKNIFLKKGTVA